MLLKFTKMHGLGNDFMVIDAINQTPDLSAETLIRLSNRHTGIGFDQCLVIEKSSNPDIDFFYRIFNANGGEVGQCGNGARCLARFVTHYGLTAKTKIRVATRTTQLLLQINPDNSVTVDMGIPKFSPNEIPFTGPGQSQPFQIPLKNGQWHHFHAINVGNPHAVTLIESIQEAPASTLGREISEHAMFPEQVNAGFMAIKTKNQIQLRVYERGCGETLACGSGAIAAAAVGRLYFQMDDQIKVDLPGGKLLISWPDIQGPIYLTGPAEFVYEGVLQSCVS